MCIYADDPTPEEGRKLQRINRSGTHSAFVFKRAQVILLSAQRYKVPEIASMPMLELTEETVRIIIHDWNEKRMDALKAKHHGGKGKRFDEEDRAKIKKVALARPQDLGLPFTQWSLKKLADHLMDNEVVEGKVHTSTLRYTLKEMNITFKRTKTWKESNDPDFEQKKTG